MRLFESQHERDDRCQSHRSYWSVIVLTLLIGVIMETDVLLVDRSRRRCLLKMGFGGAEFPRCDAPPNTSLSTVKTGKCIGAPATSSRHHNEYALLSPPILVTLPSRPSIEKKWHQFLTQYPYRRNSANDLPRNLKPQPSPTSSTKRAGTMALHWLT